MDKTKEVKLYTLSEIAQKTGLASSTVRYYKESYKDFYPSVKVEGKRYPLYEEQAIEVTNIIRESYNQDKEKHEILRRLESDFGVIINGNDNDNKEPKNKNNVGANKQGGNYAQVLAETNKKQLMNNYNAQVSQLITSQDSLLSYYKRRNKELEETLKGQEAEIKELKRELEDLKEGVFNKNQEIEELKNKLEPNLIKRMFG
jgi:DNA-binding transcriptional MerR regulator